ncbi:PREDICTED: centrosomal protein of 170 kDa protein B isoform X2 [Thamnophis sirtalis]|uniref:Centrosomal protein of 170 kDa protein B isoform X2 n=1 Tax=Thamnophis sirtalis TaxID=35019 RepID=A0A6I9XC35_9SAUR|nr:PREDICTED: centrosomal protein of 170 kDa protein B isoform X2 [Thamnophis sirtalis]
MPNSKMSTTSWFLVSGTGIRHRLPREMIFVGREDCELMLHSRSVDKQHAVINYDKEKDEHWVKDLGSLNGTFVNDIRIPDQKYITLKLNDVIRFGYDANLYVLEHIKHKVPEEVLKHEKYTSQLQMSFKGTAMKRAEQPMEHDGNIELSQTKLEKGEKKAMTEVTTTYRTPLYGRPSWWGEDDANHKLDSTGERRPEEQYSEKTKDLVQHEEEINGNISGYRESQGETVYAFRREPSYFEIPTKEFHQPVKTPEVQVHEIPTKDVDVAVIPVVQSHASFTIEFDDCTPGKMKIKDHVTKFSLRQRRNLSKDAGHVEVISAENKVADWLVHNDPSLIRRQSPGDDVYSTKSDLPVHVKTLKGNRHEDGTQSDSEDQVAPKPEKETVSNEQMIEQAKLQRQIRRDPQEMLHNQQAFVIEFFDDDVPRKKRSQSFTHSGHSTQNEVDPTLKTKVEKRKITVPAEKPVSSMPSQHPPATGTKGPSNNPFTTPRAGSFRREKADERISPSPSSTSRTPVKSYGSVGRKSKLAQEFAAECLRESVQATQPNIEKPPPVPTPLSSRTVIVPTAPETIPPPIADPKVAKAKKQEEEDSLSETGTYTIETESQDKEVEEARKMIDQVFGVLESPEFSRTSSTFRPVIKGEKEELGHNHLFGENGSAPKVTMMQVIASKVASGHHGDIPVSSSVQSSQKWISRWASLADSYPGSGSAPGAVEAEQGPHCQVSTEKDSSPRMGESEISVASRTRRLLPQLPPGEKLESPTPAILICHEIFPEVSQRNFSNDSREEIYVDSDNRLLTQEDLDPDSLSDTSKSDDGINLEKGRKSQDGTKTSEQSRIRAESAKSRSSQCPMPRLSGLRALSDPLSASFYIDDEAEEIGVPSKLPSSIPPHPPEIDKEEPPFKYGKTAAKGMNNTCLYSNGKMVMSLHQGLPEQQAVATKEISSFVRQESFTKEKSSSNIPQNRLPHISSHPLLKDLEVTRANRMDYNPETHLLLKDTETALAALEAKILCQTHQLDAPENPPGHLEDSLSGESDVDTASTVSLVSGKNLPSHPPKQKSVSPLQKERSLSTPSGQEQNIQASARDRLSEKRKAIPPETGSKGENARRFQVKHSVGTSGSQDYTDDERSSSLPYLPPSEIASSDQEQLPSRPLSRKKPFSQSTKEDHNKVTTTVQKIQQVLTRSNSLSTPRPTRASKLRRARLGDTSDNESADTEKTAAHPEGTTASSKQPVEAKKLSRLDILAMPRKRAGSFTVPSDSESAPSKPTFSGRSAESYYSTRKPLVSEAKNAVKKTAAVVAASKQSFSRTRSSSVKYASTSTTQTPRTRSSGLNKQKHSSSREMEDEDYGEQDPYNFIVQTAEIAEIARLSQTLVKDVAILAREIHDVAGDGDSQSSSGTGPSTAHSSVPNTPASTISAREELVQHISEASLNFQKVPPGSLGFRDFDQNMNDSREEDITKRTRIRNREEVIFDNLMLNPVSQLSHTIRENTENLAEKMKILFQNTERTWEEMEAKINSDNEVPILKTSNKEISSILKELRRVQKQLEVINAIIDPSGNLDLLTNNKNCSVLQPEAAKVRTANNTSGSVLESLSPVKKMNYTPKSNFGSTGLQDKTFVPDGEKYVI